VSALPKPEKRQKAPRKRIRTRRPLGTVRKEAKAAHEIDPDTWAAVLRFFGGRCAYCLNAPYEQQDHLEPIAHGGLNVIQNAYPICKRCNAEKGTSRLWRPERYHPYYQEIAP
jgi:5-methylcytosine-specific restriction endonuclease McrA